MIILGIDPGTTRIGFGVIHYENGKLNFIDAGLLLVSQKHSNEEKLTQQRNDLLKIIQKHQPQHAAIERIFFSKNTKTAIQVAQSRGVVMETCNHQGLRISEFTPLQAKQAVSGYGRATKEQMQRMVKHILNLSFNPEPDDVADALALAICYAHSIPAY